MKIFLRFYLVFIMFFVFSCQKERIDFKKKVEKESIDNDNKDSKKDSIDNNSDAETSGTDYNNDDNSLVNKETADYNPNKTIDGFCVKDLSPIKKTYFEVGDKVFYIDNGVVHFALWNGERWNLPLSFSGKIYYPVPYDLKEGSNINYYDFRVSQDQSNREYLKFYNTIVADVRNGEVGDFSSIMAKVRIRLNSRSYSKDELNYAEVKFFSVIKSKLNLKTSIFDIDNTLVSKNIDEVYCGRDKDKEFSAYVLPQNLNNFMPFKLSQLITVNIDNKDFSFYNPYFENSAYISDLQAGKELVIDVYLDKKDYSSYCNSTRFVYGVTPPKPTDWVMGNIFPHDYPCLTDKTAFSLGIYDVKKVNPHDYSPNGDGNKCWVASSANVINWWLHNKGETYLKKINYRGPFYVDTNRNDVYDFLQQHCINQANNPKFALNMFFHGGVSFKTGKEVGGYFKNILKGRDIIRTYNLSNSPNGWRIFNELMHEIVDNKLSILFYTEDHAMNIWGADFNKNGEVSAIYYVDNDDRFSASGFIMSLKKDEVYRDNNNIKMKNGKERGIGAEIRNLLILPLNF